MAISAKKIFLFLSLGAVFIFSSAGQIALAQEQKEAEGASTNTSATTSTGGLLEKIWNNDIVPAMRSCWDIAVTVFNEAKKFIKGEKDIKILIGSAIGSIRAEYGREMEDLKNRAPKMFKGQIEWFQNFSDNWYNP